MCVAHWPACKIASTSVECKAFQEVDCLLSSCRVCPAIAASSSEAPLKQRARSCFVHTPSVTFVMLNCLPVLRGKNSALGLGISFLSVLVNMRYQRRARTGHNLWSGSESSTRVSAGMVTEVKAPLAFLEVWAFATYVARGRRTMNDQ